MPLSIAVRREKPVREYDEYLKYRGRFAPTIIAIVTCCRYIVCCRIARLENDFKLTRSLKSIRKFGTTESLEFE